MYASEGVDSITKHFFIGNIEDPLTTDALHGK